MITLKAKQPKKGKKPRKNFQNPLLNEPSPVAKRSTDDVLIEDFRHPKKVEKKVADPVPTEAPEVKKSEKSDDPDALPEKKINFGERKFTNTKIVAKKSKI